MGADAVPQFRPMACPRCGNVVFRFVPRARIPTAGARRECHGPRSCGNVWDPGDRGREIVGWRPEARRQPAEPEMVR